MRMEIKRMNQRRLLTTREVANYLGCSPKHVWRLTRSHGLPFVRLGRAIRFKPSEVEGFLTRSSSGMDSTPLARGDAL
jgi:excisionase family DNA binding protein